jgi:hypothetical protein
MIDLEDVAVLNASDAIGAGAEAGAEDYYLSDATPNGRVEQVIDVSGPSDARRASSWPAVVDVAAQRRVEE